MLTVWVSVAMLCRSMYAMFLFGFSVSCFSASPLEETQALNILAPDLPGTSEEGVYGRDIEIVDRTLSACGYQVNFIIQPFGRHWWSFKYLERVDGVMTVPLGYFMPGFSTSAYIWYQNGAFYDASELAPIETVDDLHGLNVVTFQDGPEILGLEDKLEEFESILAIADQTIHSRLLLKGRVDAILADGLIVAEVNQRIVEASEYNSRLVSKLARLEFSPIFVPTPYKMVYKDPALAYAFDRCFDQLFMEGVITKISDRYTYKHRDQLRHRYLGQ